ncbi:MAG TPA: protein translocase subunit SecF, partial [Methanocorpusculum sp.]|nr:protein translocase subunit SecF [Methanocorpusculum sp.]
MKKFQYNIEKFDKRKMVGIPSVFLIVALIIVIITFISCGLPVNPSIDFKGGTAVSIHTDQTQDQIAEYFAKYTPQSIERGIGGSYYLKFSVMDNDTTRTKFIEYIHKGYPDANIDQFSETFSSTLQHQAILALIFAFLGMAVVVFIAFRKIVPAITVVASGFADITITCAVMDVIGIRLSLATTAALLMLVGYSVDSNILMTTKVLKHKGDTNEKFAGAFRTGFIMTSTTFCAILMMFIVSLFGQVQTLYLVSSVLLIGLLCDFIFTWAFNAGILKLYLDSKDPTGKRVTVSGMVTPVSKAMPEIETQNP